MKQAIAKIALGIFGLAFLASLPMPSAPGGLVFIYGILSISALIACLTASTKNIRLLALFLLVLAVVLTILEVRTGDHSFGTGAKQYQLHQPSGTAPIF